MDHGGAPEKLGRICTLEQVAICVFLSGKQEPEPPLFPAVNALTRILKCVSVCILRQE
ncbi:hypothetical protein Fmac_020186 [Flemingia macrophylla]|uniref:Uncharacterized protein n=1 Tax=Flemingia macrophylla TaxID=520843 RepID=A0ABD1LTD4_9FABA